MTIAPEEVAASRRGHVGEVRRQAGDRGVRAGPGDGALVGADAAGQRRFVAARGGEVFSLAFGHGAEPPGGARNLRAAGHVEG